MFKFPMKTEVGHFNASALGTKAKGRNPHFRVGGGLFRNLLQYIRHKEKGGGQI